MNQVMTRAGRHRSHAFVVRPGISLVELLIVIGIMVAVFAVAIPVVRLATTDNRVALATQTVRSFLMEAAAAAERDGKSHIIFERSLNNPNYCYRLYRGRPRPPYRGEAENAYAIKGHHAQVMTFGVPDGPPSVEQDADTVTMTTLVIYDTFYLFNVDASKIRLLEYLTFPGRPEKYLIYHAYQLPASASVHGPVAAVFCRLDPIQPLSHLKTSRLGCKGLPFSSPFGYFGEYPEGGPGGWKLGYRGPHVNGFEYEFFPADPALFPPNAPSSPRPPVPLISSQFASTGVWDFEISQPPMLDELNYLDLPQGMAIYLGGSGFGDIDAVIEEGIFHPNSPQFTQFAFDENLTDFLPTIWPRGLTILRDSIDAELKDPTISFVKNENSLIRREYFPRIEFEAGGSISRAFVMSPRYTMAVSGMGAPPGSNRIGRLGPIYPMAPLFLLIGEDNVPQRSKLPMDSPVLDNDYWIMLGAQTTKPKIIKAQVGVSLEAAHAAVSEGISER